MSLLAYHLDRALDVAKIGISQSAILKYQTASKFIKKVAENNKLIRRPNQRFYTLLSESMSREQVKYWKEVLIKRIASLMDAECRTCCVWPDGNRLNPLPLPTSDDAAKIMSGYSLPITSCPLPHLIVWAFDSYERSSGLCCSLMRITRESCSELYATSVRKGNVIFSYKLLDEWADEIEKKFAAGAITCAKYGYYHRAIEIVSSVAQTGNYEKRRIRKYDVPESFRHSEFYMAVYAALEKLTQVMTPIYHEQVRVIADKLCRFAWENGFNELSSRALEQFYEQKLSQAHPVVAGRCISLYKELDAAYSLHVVRPNSGLLFNELNIDESLAAEVDGLTLEQKQERPIEVVIAQAKAVVTKLGLTKSTVDQYARGWRLFMGFSIPRYGTLYCHAAVDEYMADVVQRFKTGKLPEWKLKLYRRALLVLKEVAESNGFTWRKFKFIWQPLPPEAELVREQFLKELRQQNLSEARIDFYGYVARKFFLCSGITTKGELALMGEDTVVKVSGHFKDCCCNSSLGNITSTLRAWYEWLFKAGYAAKDFSRLIVSVPHIDNHVVPYFSEEDELKIRKALPGVDPRNKAIILLALDLGLRNSDIINLRLSNIDWKNERISIIQHKTGVPITCPLLEEVGNALFDYLTGHRPEKAEGDYVFVSKHGPYQHIGKSYQLVSGFCKALGVKPQNGHGIGPHTLRHTFTRRLLSSGEVPHQTVTAALGHKTNSADRHYRSIEDERLMECALDLSEIGGYNWED